MNGPYLHVKVAARKAGITYGAIEQMIFMGHVVARRGPALGKRGHRTANYVRVGDVKKAEFNERTRRELAEWERRFRNRIVGRMRRVRLQLAKEVAS